MDVNMKYAHIFKTTTQNKILTQCLILLLFILFSQIKNQNFKNLLYVQEVVTHQKKY